MSKLVSRYVPYSTRLQTLDRDSIFDEVDTLSLSEKNTHIIVREVNER